jgi:hypothetical protein
MGVWTHLIFEAYCSYSWGRDKYVQYVAIDRDENGKLLEDKNGNFKTTTLPKRLNPFYYSKKKRPNWCKLKNRKLMPCPKCDLACCPFLIMCPVSKKDYKTMVTAWEKTVKWPKK